GRLGGHETVDRLLAAEQVAQAEVLERVADQTVPRRTECLAVAPEAPDDTDRGHRPHTHHHHVQDTLDPDHAAIEEGHTRCHQQHERGARENPGGITAIDKFHEAPLSVFMKQRLRPAVSGPFLVCYSRVSNGPPGLASCNSGSTVAESASRTRRIINP